MKIKGLKLSFLFLTTITIGFGQGLGKNLKTEIEIGTFITKKEVNPFWFRENNFGETDDGRTIRAIATIGKDYDSLYSSSKKLLPFALGYGARFHFVGGSMNKVIVAEGFMKGRLKIFELLVGRKRGIFGLSDSTNSSGHIAYSQNTIPLPKVEFCIPEYTSFFSQNLIQLKAGLNHSWFGKQYYTKNSYLHQKWLYLKIGKPLWKINFYAGVNHQVQWGGEINNLSSHIYAKNGRFPSTITDYIYAVSGVSLIRQKDNLDPNDYTIQDLTNRVGNHVGSIDMGFEINTSRFKALVYRQSIYDDGSLFYLTNITDGLLGLSLNNLSGSGRLKLVNLTLEYLNTTNQGGRLGPDQNSNYLRGIDNYFNNAQFLDGWSYNEKTIGTPFISSQNYLLSSLPSYDVAIANEPARFFTNNNRVRAIYIGIIGEVFETDFKFKYSISENSGTYIFPFNRKYLQKSYLIESTRQIIQPKLSATLAFSLDSSGILNNNVGFYLGLIKNLN